MSKVKTSHLLIIFIILLVILSALNSKDLLSKFENQNLDKNVAFSIKNEANAVYNYCLDENNFKKGKENCYAKEFEKIGEKNGSDFSFRVLDVLQGLDPDAKGCHFISHEMGFGSYKREPDNWRILIQDMPTVCNYGAIHGVLQGYIGSLPEGSLSRDVIPTICGENPRADCNHMIGHLLLVETNADIPKALDLCNVFSSPAQKDFCLTGVFMEWETALNLVEHDLVPESWLNWPPRLPSLEKLCRSFEGGDASACWKEIVHVALAKFKNDPKQTWDFCNTAQVPEGAKRCVRHSIGIIGASRNFDLPSLMSMCSIPQKNNPNFEEKCYSDLVASALSTIPTMVPEAVSFCNSLNSKFKPACFSMIGATSFSNKVIKDKLPKACKATSSDLRDYCLGLASVMREPSDMNFND